jgi:hypothetical protein
LVDGKDDTWTGLANEQREVFNMTELLESIDMTLKLYLGYRAGLITQKQIAEYLGIDIDALEKEKYFL